MAEDIHKNIGLRGVIVGSSFTSDVNPDTGVTYLGIPIFDLYDLDVVAVYLAMINRNWPNAKQMAEFKDDVVRRRKNFPLEICDIMNAIPEAHPMEKMIQGLCLAGTKRGRYTTGRPQFLEGVKECVAWMPLICAAAITGKRPAVPSTYQSYGQIMADEMKMSSKVGRFLDQFCTVHADHGGGNLSTFIAKAAGSGHVELWYALAAGMIGLYGERHGKANQQSLAEILDFHQRMQSSGKSAKELIKENFEKEYPMFGFGHAVLRKEDPRAKIFYKLAEELIPDSPLLAVAKQLRTGWPEFVEQVANPTRAKEGKSQIQNPYPNVDQVSGAILYELGFKDPRMFTVLFGLARNPCIAAQLHHEAEDHVPLYRPRYPYTGGVKPLPTGAEYKALLAPSA
ncbi:MAG: citrate/2-methylcitrate synthase [Candidatus Lambdaproteobacteria bacterium]|nr:citrate/2-methylcitrate synthase [Candidatus Lambdaproteobacteria bacterium]